MPRSGPWRTRLFRVGPHVGAALGTASSRCSGRGRDGERVLVARRRVRGLGVRREAGAAARTARALPRQVLRAAGERAGLAPWLPAGRLGRPTHMSPPAEPRPSRPQPPRADPLRPQPPRRPFAHAERASPEPHRVMSAHLASGRSPHGSWSHTLLWDARRSAVTPLCLLRLCSPDPQKSGHRPLVKPWSCLLPKRWRPTHGPALVLWIPPARLNPPLTVKIVQLYPFLRAHLKCCLLQEAFSGSLFQSNVFVFDSFLPFELLLKYLSVSEC